MTTTMAPIEPETATGAGKDRLDQARQPPGLTPAHTYIGHNIPKVEATELDAARGAESSDQHVAGPLKLSDAAAESSGHVDQVTIDEARPTGVIGEPIANLVRNILTGDFNVLADVENDWLVVEL